MGWGCVQCMLIMWFSGLHLLVFGFPFKSLCFSACLVLGCTVGRCCLPCGVNANHLEGLLHRGAMGHAGAAPTALVMLLR